MRYLLIAALVAVATVTGFAPTRANQEILVLDGTKDNMLIAQALPTTGFYETSSGAAVTLAPPSPFTCARWGPQLAWHQYGFFVRLEYGYVGAGPCPP